MNLRLLTDDQLHASNMQNSAEERLVTLKVLKHLSETERRHLYSKYDCDSLHAYCVKYLKYSEGQAGRHVAASRLMRDLPVIEEKIISGAMTFTSVCQVSSYLNKELRAGHTVDRAAKLQLLEQIDHQPQQKVEQILLSHSSNPDIHVRESVKQKTESLTELKLVADTQCMVDLNRLKEIFSHSMPGATYSDIVKRLARKEVEAVDPNLKAKRAAARVEKRQLNSNLQRTLTSEPEWKKSPAKFRSRYIPAPIRHAVWMRDGGRCTFVNEQTGECCESRHFVQCDHIIAFANGGEHTVGNLRLRCRAHNQRHAIDVFGFRRASSFRKNDVQVSPVRS